MDDYLVLESEAALGRYKSQAVLQRMVDTLSRDLTDGRARAHLSRQLREDVEATLMQTVKLLRVVINQRKGWIVDSEQA